MTSEQANIVDGLSDVPTAGMAARELAQAMQTLRRCDLCRGLRPEQLHDIATAARLISVRSGDVICRQGEPGSSMYIVARGRVRVAVETEDGGHRMLDYLGRGEHFGDLAMLVQAHRPATVTAVMDTQVLELDHQHFEKLLESVPAFGVNLSRSLGFRLHRLTAGTEKREKLAVVGLVSSTLRTRGLVRPLADALIESGDAIEVLTDRSERWPTGGEYLIERIPSNLQGQARAEAVHERITQVLEHNDRILVDVTMKGLEDGLPYLLVQCEQIWWLVESRFAESSLAGLERLLAIEPRLGPRVHVVWVQTEDERFAPGVPENLRVARPDFKVVLDEHGARPSVQQRQSISRLVRHLRGRRIGLALSGGGARGLAHLGVLRAFEREGIFFDLVAGTSSGALTGLAYAGGWSPEFAVEHFQADLTPPGWLRRMPGGSRWYMWAMFRAGAWDHKLRAYLGDARLEQLRVPFYTVAVDLVSGRQVVRERGDTVEAVLESINLPMISRPILRDGMALVDGGVLNNLPADILPERGANLIVGVDVMRRLGQSFGGNEATTPTHLMRRPGPIETLLRVNEVLDHGISKLRSNVVDVMITPDTSAFEFADFSRARELADVGEAAAREAMPQLKQVLADLESR